MEKEGGGREGRGKGREGGKKRRKESKAMFGKRHSMTNITISTKHIRFH